MITLILFTSFLLLCSWIGRHFLLLSSQQNHRLDDAFVVSMGFFVLTVLSSIIGFGIPSNMRMSASVIWFFVLAAVLVASRLRTNSLPRNQSSQLRLAPLLSLGILVMSISSGIALRFHASPDIHGVASVVGYLAENPSLESLRQMFVETSGASKPVMAGQATPLMNSVWNIPDAQMRFAADQVLTAGRYGFNLVLAMLWTLGRFDGHFEGLLTLFSLWAATSAILVAIQISIQIRTIVKRQYDAITRLQIFPLYLIAAIFMLSPLIQVFILEGSAPQIWVVVATLCHLKLHLDRLDGLLHNFPKQSNLICLSLPPMFLAASYPQGLLPIFAISLLFFLLELTIAPFGVKTICKTILAYSAVMTLPLLLFYHLARFNFVQLTKAFLRSESGAAFNIGFSPLFESVLQGYHSFDYELVSLGRGGFMQAGSQTKAAAHLLLLIVFMVVAVIVASRRAGRKEVMLATSLGLLGLIFVIQPLQLMLRRLNINSYFYIRGIQFVFFVAVIVLVLCTLVIATKSNLKSLLLVGFLVVICGWQIFGFLHRGHQYREASYAFSVTNQDQRQLMSENVIFLTDQPRHSVFSLSLWRPNVYVTDTWAPRLIQSQFPEELDCIYLKFEDERVVEVLKIGTIRMSHTIDGPITVSDLQSLTDFRPNENFLDALSDSGP